MTYRDDLEAAGERAHALERDLARAKDENERLRQELEDTKNPLAAQAAQGRAIREASEQTARKQHTDRQVARLRAAERAFPHSITRWGYFARPQFLIGFPLFVWALMGLVYLLSEGRFPPPLAFLGPALIAFPVFAAARKRVRAAVPRERAWVASLPFKVIGYDLYFTGGGTTLRALVNFKGKRPDEALLRDALLVLDPGSHVAHHKGTEPTINRRAHIRFHELAALLVKIHDEFPIESVLPELD